MAVIEAMKMENILFAAADGVVKDIMAQQGESLAVDQPIVEFEIRRDSHSCGSRPACSQETAGDACVPA